MKIKAFTIIELLLAMTIIAILIGLLGFGVSIALRSSRDSQRRDTLEGLKTSVQLYYNKYNEYPDSLGVFGSDNSQLAWKADAASTNPLGEKVYTSGAAVPAPTTTNQGTAYSYDLTEDGYVLCVKLETGEIFDLSQGVLDCTQNQGTNPL